MIKQTPEKISSPLKFVKFAFRGIYQSVLSERNSRIHWLAAIAVTIAGIFVGLSPLEWCVLVIFYSLVISAEMFNSAIEKLVDKVSPEYSKMAGIIKDISAGAVLITVIFAIVGGCIIFIPKLFD